MKLLLYLLALVGGGAAGAVGVGSYMVYTGDPLALEGEAAAGELEAENEASQEEAGEAGSEGAGGAGGGAEAGGSGGAGGLPGGPQLADGPEAGGAESVEGSANTSAEPGSAEPEGSGDVAAAIEGQGTATETPVPVQQVAEPEADSLARVQQNYQRLARIFAAMGPAEAAAVLSQLDDEQLEGILLAMQGRNAAPILEEMDPVRAAALSSRILRGGEE